MSIIQPKTTCLKFFLIISFTIMALSIASCNSLNNSFTTSTSTPAFAFTPTITHTPTSTTVTNTATITPSSTPSPKPTIASTPTRTETPTRIPTRTPTPTPTIDPSWIFFESEWLTLYYPPDWTVLNPREHACLPGSTDCIFRLSHLTSENIEMELIRYPPGLPSHRNVKEADQWYWDNTSLSARLIGASDRLKLLSRNDIVIDGLAAVRRLYEYPLVNPTTNKIIGTQYNYQVLILQDKDLYNFRVFTDNAAEFDMYKGITDQLIYTIVFQK